LDKLAQKCSDGPREGPGAAKVIGNLQILRAYAASGVVIYHCNAWIAGIHTEFYGVALFFALSGYIMCKIRNRSAWDFAQDRVWRIVPNYWLAMIMMLTALKMWTWWPIEHTLLSFLFVPHDSPAGLYPVLGVGWTLNIEMYFYALFALSILISRRFAPLIAGASIIAMKYGLPYVTDSKPLMFYYTHDYVNYFVYGIAIWYATEWIKDANLRLPSWTFPVSLAGYSVMVIFNVADPHYLVPALFATTVLASNSGADLALRPLVLMGDASYACYLLHTILIEVLRHVGLPVYSGTVLMTILILVIAWGLAIGWHLTIERAVSRLSRSWRNVAHVAPTPNAAAAP
jgi:exopolysaccharide production protein ExoZ